MDTVRIDNLERFQLNMVRIVACLSIYLCHVMNEVGGKVGVAFGQLLNVGVPIFLMLSGTLYGSKEIRTGETINWYRKQFRKIMLPLWMFLIALFVMLAINKIFYDWIFWLHSIVPIIGISGISIPAAGHLWFITDLLICYLFTPLFMKIKKIKFLTLGGYIHWLS